MDLRSLSSYVMNTAAGAGMLTGFRGVELFVGVLLAGSVVVV